MTRPIRSASSAGIGSPTSAISAARAAPTSRGRNHVAPLSGHEPDPPERQHEPRVGGGDPQVAGERERRAGAGRHAVDGRDHRLAHGAEGPDDRVVALAELLIERRGVGSLPLRQVLAGTERATRRRSG